MQEGGGLAPPPSSASWRFTGVRRGFERVSFVVSRGGRDDEGWTIDGVPHPELADCNDLDLQVSLLTNTAPVRRAIRRRSLPAPAVYLTSSLDVERIDQTYRRRPGAGWEYDYDSPAHGYRATLRFDGDGLVRDYPFLGRRT